MITVQFYDYPMEIEYTDGMTAGSLIQKITDDHGFQWNGSPAIQDVTQNTFMQDTDPIVDGRRYYMIGWIRKVVDP